MYYVLTPEEVGSIKFGIVSLKEKISRAESLIGSLSPESKVGSSYDRVLCSLEGNRKMLSLYEGLLSF